MVMTTKELIFDWDIADRKNFN